MFYLLIGTILFIFKIDLFGILIVAKGINEILYDKLNEKNKILDKITGSNNSLPFYSNKIISILIILLGINKKIAIVLIAIYIIKALLKIILIMMCNWLIQQALTMSDEEMEEIRRKRMEKK